MRSYSYSLWSYGKSPLHNEDNLFQPLLLWILLNLRGLTMRMTLVKMLAEMMPAEMLVRFEPGTELAPGIRSVAAFGHTPGHTLFDLQSAGRNFVYVGDLTNVPALFARNPDWAVTFDMDAEAARKVRRETFQRIVAGNAMVGGFHFPFPAFGTIEPSGNGYQFVAVS